MRDHHFTLPARTIAGELVELLCIAAFIAGVWSVALVLRGA